MGRIVLLPNAYAEVLTPSVSVYLETVFKEASKVKWGHWVGF